MALFVPILSVFLLFINIYETFKTLKPPRLSRNGQPSVRATTQRKRDMKGCMAIWLVWTCLTIFERTFESIVGLFVPFYNEFKAFALIFLLLSRARGAEPIYLHFLRPLIKPYVSTLDWTLEVLHTFGDFAALLLFLPFSVIMAWWNPSDDVVPPAPGENESSSRESSLDGHNREQAAAIITEMDEVQRKFLDRQRQEAVRRGDPSTVGLRTRKPAAQNRNASGPVRGNTAVRPRDPRRNATQPTRPAYETRRTSESVRQTGSSRGRAVNHQIWHPPAATRDQRDAAPEEQPQDDRLTGPGRLEDIATNMSMPVPHHYPDESSASQQGPSNSVEEWRMYPPFPSAYPPTPLPASNSLATEADANKHASSNGFIIPPPPILYTGAIDASTPEKSHGVEEWRMYPPFPSAYPPTPLPLHPLLISEPNPPPRLRTLSETTRPKSEPVPPEIPPERARAPTRPNLGPASQSLPSRSGARRSARIRGGESARVNGEENADGQDFGRSLELQRESTEGEDSGSRSGSGDDNDIRDGGSLQDVLEVKVEDVDIEENDEIVEDGLSDVMESEDTLVGSVETLRGSLRPPLHPLSQPAGRRTRSRVAPSLGAKYSVSTSSMLSMKTANSNSTALTTASEHSSLRTMSREVSSASSAAMSRSVSASSSGGSGRSGGSESSGRKRTHSQVAGSGERRDANLRVGKRGSQPKKENSRVKPEASTAPGRAPTLMTRGKSTGSETLGDTLSGGDPAGAGDSDAAPAEDIPTKKRRRVAQVRQAKRPAVT